MLRLHKQVVWNQQSGIYLYTGCAKQNKNKTTSPTLNGTLNLIKDSGRLLGTSQNCFSRTLQSHKRSHKGGKYCNTNRVCTSTLIPAPKTFSLVPTIGFFLKNLTSKSIQWMLAAMSMSNIQLLSCTCCWRKTIRSTNPWRVGLLDWHLERYQSNPLDRSDFSPVVFVFQFQNDINDTWNDEKHWSSSTKVVSITVYLCSMLKCDFLKPAFWKYTDSPSTCQYWLAMTCFWTEWWYGGCWFMLVICLSHVVYLGMLDAYQNMYPTCSTWDVGNTVVRSY